MSSTKSPLEALMGTFIEALEAGQETLADSNLDLRTRMTEASGLMPSINYVLSRNKSHVDADPAAKERRHASVIGAVAAIAAFRKECIGALENHELEKAALNLELLGLGIRKGPRKRAMLEMDETRPPIKARELHRMKSSLAYYTKRTQGLGTLPH